MHYHTWLTVSWCLPPALYYYYKVPETDSVKEEHLFYWLSVSEVSVHDILEVSVQAVDLRWGRCRGRRMWRMNAVRSPHGGRKQRVRKRLGPFWGALQWPTYSSQAPPFKRVHHFTIRPVGEIRVSMIQSLSKAMNSAALETRISTRSLPKEPAQIRTTPPPPFLAHLGQAFGFPHFLVHLSSDSQVSVLNRIIPQSL